MAFRRYTKAEEVNVIATQKLAEASKQNPVFKDIETEQPLPVQEDVDKDK